MVNLLLFGLGAVGRALLLVLAREKPAWLTRDSTLLIVDREDREELLGALGVAGLFTRCEFVRAHIRKRTHRRQFADIMKGRAFDAVVDATYNVCTLELVQLFSELGVPYMNSSVEKWDEDEPDDITAVSAASQSLFERQKEIREARFASRATALLDMGMNPGVISAMAKRAVRRFYREQFGKLPVDIPLAALKLDIRAAIISELDGQVSNRPRAPGEFVNTWSVDGYAEEAFAPAEYTDREVGPVIDPTVSYYNLTFARVPSRYITGYAIRHSESITIGHMLQGPAKTPPATVWYCYHSCDASLASLFEAQNAPANARYQTKRTMYDEIVSGKDEIGILMVSPRHGAWFCGSVQSIEETRALFPGKEAHINVTTLQTACGYYTGLSWILANPREGVCFPEVIPEEYLFDMVEHLLGPMFDGPLPFSLNEKPPRKAGEKREPVADPYSFRAFVV